MPMGEPKCTFCGGEFLSGSVHTCRFQCTDCEGLRHRLNEANLAFQNMLEDRTARVNELKGELAAAQRRLKPLMEVVAFALMKHAETGCKDGCWFPKERMEAAFEAATKDLVCVCADFDPDAVRCVRCGGKIG